MASTTLNISNIRLVNVPSNYDIDGTGRRHPRNSTEHTDADLRAHAVTTQNLPFALKKNSAHRRCSSCTPTPPRATRPGRTRV